MKAIDLSGKVSKSYNSILMIKITSVSDGVNLLSSVLKISSPFWALASETFVEFWVWRKNHKCAEQWRFPQLLYLKFCSISCRYLTKKYTKLRKIFSIGTKRINWPHERGRWARRVWGHIYSITIILLLNYVPFSLSTLHLIQTWHFLCIFDCTIKC